MESTGITLLTGISTAEKVYVRGGIIDNCRVDGRQRFEFRPLQLARGVHPSALGSARVRNEESDVICTVTADLATPSLDTPHEGKIYVSVNFASTTAADVHLRLFNDDARSLSRRLGRAVLQGPLNPSFVPRSSLVVVPYRFVWRVCVDIMILSVGGSLQDVISFAVMSALRDTRLPAIKVVLDDRSEKAAEETFDYTDLLEEENISEESVSAGDDGLFDTRILQLNKVLDFEIAREVKDKPFPCAENVPIMLSIGQVNEFHLCDLTHDERASLDSMFTGLIIPNGKVVGLRKVGSGTPVPLSSVSSLLPLLQSLGADLLTKLLSAVDRAVDTQDDRLVDSLLLTV